MHYAILVISILAAWKYGDWQRWREYLPTIYYFIFNNILYEYLSSNVKYLWRLENPILSEQFNTLVYSFIIYPALITLYIGNFPEHKREQFIHFIKWFSIFAIAEWIGLQYGNISYMNGWSFTWSLFFIFIMLFMLRVHHLKAGLAIILTPLWIIFFCIIFELKLW